MKLKKMEIVGFKSFLDKACIDFPAGISAIVGPNGCGKSNIIDAMRWVMGEQSVKQLRGKAMEDVIFAGTKGTPPMNMAEVTLTMANDNGSAPEELKDFTEIQITRRLFRSGESAYLLNKQPCRLKDIHNLFLGSGMGAKSYALIQQGNIGAITDASPEERRFFIEEAAGVTRYKQRKIEALRKVKGTHQNLLRLKDIISEVKRQMAGLKRQARKAEVFKSCQQQIKMLDIGLALRQFDQHDLQLTETNRLIQVLQNTDLAHTTQIKQLDAAVETIKVKRFEQNQVISEQKANKFDLQRQIDKMENDLVHDRQDSERLSVEISTLAASHRDLEEKNCQMLVELAQVEAEASQLQRQHKEVQSELTQQREASRASRRQLEQLQQAQEKAKADLMRLVAEEARYQNIYQTAESNRDNVQRRLKRIDEEEALALRKVAACEAAEHTIRTDLERTRQRMVNLGQQNEAKEDQLRRQNRQLGEQVKAVQTIELQIKEVRSHHATLKKMEDNLEWYKDGVKAIIKHKEKTDLDAPGTWIGSVVGVMADMLEPEPDYITAVEAALGETLQYVLVKDQLTARNAIAFLQAHEAGRSGFVPLDGLKAQGAALPEGGERLLDHVTVAEGFEQAADVLLGRVVVCEDLEKALLCWNGNGRHQAVVTRQGDVIAGNGLLNGGSRTNGSGILAKKREIKALAQQLAQMERKLEAAKVKLSTLEADARRLEGELQQLIAEQRQCEQNAAEAEKGLYRAEADLKSARHHLSIVQLEQEQLQGETEDIDDEIARHRQAVADIETKVRKAQAQVAQTSEQIRRHSDRMEAYHQTVIDLKMQLTALEAKRDNHHQTILRLKTFNDDGQRRVVQIAEDIAAKQHKRSSLTAHIAAAEQSLTAQHQALKTMEQTLADNEATYRLIDEHLQDHDRQIAALQDERSQNHEKLRLLEVERSQQQIKQEHIAGRIQERYHKPLLGFRPDCQTWEHQGQVLHSLALEQIQADLERLRAKAAKIGDVNLGAIQEYEQLKERCDFLEKQHDDLVSAIEDLQKVIRKINRISQERFVETFALINEKMQEVFPRLFEGGSAQMVLTEPGNPLESGVELMIHPPGKKLTRLSLLSGGEKALSAIAFLFAIFLIKPASFCLLDEIDAPLDEANIYRFNNLLRMIGNRSQIIMITHNKRSMEFADTLFGVTMEQKGVSKLVSVNLQQSAKELVN